MIKYERELKNRRNREVQLKRPKEMIIKDYKSTWDRFYHTRLSKMHVHLTL